MLNFRFIAVLLFVSIVASSASAQSKKLPPGFLLNTNRPFVYIKFDHIGPGIPWSDDESSTRIWLRLTNNCRVPVRVIANGVPDSSPRDEVGIQYKIVPVRPIRGAATMFNSEEGPKAQTGMTGDDHRDDRIPIGRSIDFGSLVVIQPGENILFSVPTNHVTRNWYPEIAFDFELPRGSGRELRDPKVSLGPHIRISYTLADMPPDARKAVEGK